MSSRKRTCLCAMIINSSMLPCQKPERKRGQLSPEWPSLTVGLLTRRFLIRRVGQQRDVARALDSFSQHALVRGARARDSPRQNFAALGNVALQQLHIFEVDQINFLDAEAANLSALHAPHPPTSHRAGAVILFESKVSIFVVSRHNLSLTPQ